MPETTVGGALASGLCCVHLVPAGPGGCLYWWWCVYWHIQQSVWTRISEEGSKRTPVILGPWFCITFHTLNHHHGYFSQFLSSSIKFSPLQIKLWLLGPGCVTMSPLVHQEHRFSGGAFICFPLLCSLECSPSSGSQLLILFHTKPGGTPILNWGYSGPQGQLNCEGANNQMLPTQKWCENKNHMKQMQEENVQPKCTRPLGGADSPEQQVGYPDES